jgi:ABC-type lipoprotein release transport system permease subunit
MRNIIERQRNIIDFTLSSLARRKGKNIALFLAYVLIVFLLASVTLFTHALKTEASLVLHNAPEIVVQRLQAGRQDAVPARYIDVLKTIRGVHEARGRLWGYYYDPVIGANYTLMVPQIFPHDDGQIIIGRGLADSRRLSQGDLFALRSYSGAMVPFTVNEVISPESELVSSDLILLSGKDFQRLFGTRAGYVTDVTLSVRNDKEIPTVAEKIIKLFPDMRVITKREILRTYESIFDWRGGLIVMILSVDALAFVIFAWDKASGLSAEEKREIGILKAVGWETSDVLLMKFWEGTVISLSSFLLGILLAYVHVFFTSVVLFEPVLKGWSVLYPEFKLVPFIDPYQIATLFFLTVVPYTVATIIPSWRAATIDPDSIMRS